MLFQRVKKNLRSSSARLKIAMRETRSAGIQRGRLDLHPADLVLKRDIQFPQIVIFDGIVKNIPVQIAKQRGAAAPEILVNTQTGFDMLRELSTIAFCINDFIHRFFTKKGANLTGLPLC